MDRKKTPDMKDVLLGLGISLVPMILALIAKRGTTRNIGRNISGVLRTNLGRKLENVIELTLHDIVAGMREDNIKQQKQIETKKSIDDIKNKSNL